jgi:hypothetical protein
MAVVKNMTDEELKQFVPKLGDRVAVKQFCQKRSSFNERKEEVLNKIRQKKKKLQGNINAIKLSRRLQLGLKMETDNGLKVVRVAKGGGTREDEVDKQMTMKALKERAKKLFFPNGNSPSGSVNSFSFKLLDVCDIECEDTDTIEEQYQKSKTKLLRIYLVCKELVSVKDGVQVAATLEDLGRMGQSVARPCVRTGLPATIQSLNINVTDSEWSNPVNAQVLMEEKPFAKGGMREAYKCMILHSDGNAYEPGRYVAKRIIGDEGDNTRDLKKVCCCGFF